MRFLIVFIFLVFAFEAKAENCASFEQSHYNPFSFIQDCQNALLIESTDLEVNRFRIESEESHRVKIIEDAEDSLNLRIELIRQAKRSIQMETFYFEPDQAGRKIIAELVKKKKTNPEVKIEILIDNWGSEGFSPSLAEELIALGIDVKYYNISSSLFFTRHNQRNHRKLFLIDADGADGFALLGGVNTAAEHLGLHPSIKKIDREALIQGPILPKIQENFYAYWRHPWSERKKNQQVTDQSLLEKILDQEKESFQTGGALTEGQWFSVPKLRFVSDGPGEERKIFNLQSDFHRQLEVSSDLLIENGYFIPPKELRIHFERILASGGKVELLTDGPLATSKYDVKKMTLSYPYQKWLVERGGGVSGSSGPGIHAKTVVQDNKNVFISTYNLDARSQNINHELGVWFENSPELARAVSDSIRSRKEKFGLKLDAKGMYGGLDLYEEFRSKNSGEERFTRWTRWLLEPLY